MSKAKSDPNYKVIAENRRARFDYAIDSDLECGVVLFGSEVKSLRIGGSNIAESYAQIENGELIIKNIPGWGVDFNKQWLEKAGYEYSEYEE